eukprot:3632168-Amphidinium_carterae.1
MGMRGLPGRRCSLLAALVTPEGHSSNSAPSSFRSFDLQYFDGFWGLEGCVAAGLRSTYTMGRALPGLFTTFALRAGKSCHSTIAHVGL